MSVEVFTPARSSFVAQLEYDDDAEELVIEFTDGYRARYFNVRKATYRNFTLAPSLGGFFHRHVKDVYPFEEA